MEVLESIVEFQSRHNLFHSNYCTMMACANESIIIQRKFAALINVELRMLNHPRDGLTN